MGGVFMSKKKISAKDKGNKKLYIATVAFSVIWLFLTQVMNITGQFENNWSDFRIRLPEYLSNILTGHLNGRFLFGKYINGLPNPKITVVALDEATLAKHGWPIKRRYYGELVSKLNKLGVKSIGVDVLIFEPDMDNPASDRKYLEAVRNSDNVINLVGVAIGTWDIKHAIKGLSEASRLVAYPNVDVAMDGDGYVRKYWPFYPGRERDESGIEYDYLTYGKIGVKKLRCGAECAPRRIASLGMAVYTIYSGKPLSELEMNYGDEKILNYRYPVKRMVNPGWNKDGTKVIDSSYRHISAVDVLDGRLGSEEKESLKGGITFIGATALGAFDHVPNPFVKLYPGVEVHATFVDNIIAGDLRRDMPGLYVSLLILLLPWIPVLLRKASLRALVGISLAVMAAIIIGDFTLLAHLTNMPFMAVMIAFFLPFAYITVDKGLSEGREKKWIKNTFGQYLSPKVVEVITKDPSKLTLGGEKRDMTVFFLDIAGFTSMSEKLTPEQLTAMLNKYLSGLTDVILKYDGVVDKFIGDCIMAFWNAPLDQKDHRKLSCLAAVDCTSELVRLNSALGDSDIKPSFRIGLNSGPMVVGNMGSSTRFSYTVLGDAVNLASRLEGANKFFHSKIMVSEDTYEGAKDAVEARVLGQIRVVGKAIPVKVYELLAHKGKLGTVQAELLAAYNEGLEYFYKGDFSKAAGAFKAALAADPKDGPSAFYLDLSEKYSAGTPQGWDGTFNLTSK
jgi:adenylate cyclase